jgi:signal transduction histidine kinase/ligand-binding sensor domain-containing protein
MRAGSRSALAAGLLLAPVAASTAQQRLVRLYDQQQGLPAPQVTALAQGDAGFLWIGTVAGLIRYDGSEMRPWGRAEVSGAIREVHGRAGLVVVRDERDALFAVHPAGLVPIPGPDGRPIIGATATHLGAGGILWVAWADRIARRDESGAWREEPAPTLARGDAWSLIRADRNVVVFGSRRRLWRRDAEGKVTPLLALDRPADVLIRGPDDFVAIGGRDSIRLVQRYAGSADTLLLLGGRRPVAVAERGGSLWISTDRGLVILRPGEPPEVLEASRGVLGGGPLLVDREESVWLGSPVGLTQFPEPETVIWGESQGLPSTRASQVALEGGQVWIATDGGLGHIGTRMMGGRIANAGLFGPVHLCRMGAGRLVATDGAERWHEFDGAAWQRAPWPGGRRLTDCAPSARGGAWLATTEGLLYLAPDGRAPRAVRTLDTVLTSVIEDRDGNIWSGGGERVCRHAPATRDLTSQEGWNCTNLAGAGDVFDFIEVDGELWAATRNGVWFHDSTGWRPLASSFELPSRRIRGFAASPSGGVWVLSAGAVVRVQPGEGPTWRVLEKVSAWQGVSVEEGSGLVEASDGTVWLANAGGVTRVPIAARRIRRDPPQVQVATVLVNGREVPAEEPIRLGSPDEVVELRFAVLTYRDRSRLQTEMQLSQNGPWSPASGGIPQFRLTQLAPGRYTAAIRASIDGERWSSPSEPISFTVAAPWYRRPSVLLLGALLAGGALVLINRARTAVLLGLERQRTAIAMDLHDELGAGLGSIGILAGVASNPRVADHERQDYAHRIAATAGELGGKLTDIVGALRSGKVTLGLLAADLAERAARLVPGPVPELRTDFPSEWPEVELDPTVRHDLRLMALEAIHNAVRHAEAKTITIGLAPEGRHWRLWVTDDGIGFDPASGQKPKGTGLGRHALQRRANRIRATLTITTALQQGTTVEVAFEPRQRHIMM